MIVPSGKSGSDLPCARLGPSAAGLPKIHFWRDKQMREVDFFIPRDRDAVDAIECKWPPAVFEMRGLAAFRENYPKGKNYVVRPLNGPGYERTQAGLRISGVSPKKLRLGFRSAKT